jgi:hypothetical protein
VAAVAEDGISGVLAAAEVDGFGFSSLEFYGRELASLVAAVAEGLAGALAAGTPVVALAGFDFDGKGTLLSNYRFWHRGLSSKLGRDIIADSGKFCAIAQEIGLRVRFRNGFERRSPAIYRIATFRRVFYWSTEIGLNTALLLRQSHEAIPRLSWHFQAGKRQVSDQKEVGEGERWRTC